MQYIRHFRNVRGQQLHGIALPNVFSLIFYLIPFELVLIILFRANFSINHSVDVSITTLSRNCESALHCDVACVQSKKDAKIFSLNNQP